MPVMIFVHLLSEMLRQLLSFSGYLFSFLSYVLILFLPNHLSYAEMPFKWANFYLAALKGDYQLMCNKTQHFLNY